MTRDQAVIIASRWGPATRKRFGFTLESLTDLVLACGDWCPLCGKKFTLTGGRPRVIDHDHSTGYARGIICRQCNDRIGWLHEDTVWMSAVVAYLNYPIAMREGIMAQHESAIGKEEAPEQ